MTPNPLSEVVLEMAKQNDRLLSRVLKLSEENLRLRSALEFYADEKNWSVSEWVVKNVDQDRNMISLTLGDTTHVGIIAEEDRGQRARDALEGK